MFVLVIVAVTLILWLATAARAAMAIRRTPRVLPLESGSGPPPRVAVFVPVRDEIEYLPRLLETLLGQHEVELEVLVYNDQSTDGSGALLDRAARRDPRLQVIHAQGSPPPGWCGKPHALTRGVEAYTGDAELWLFLDADVELAPGAIVALAEDIERSGADAVSPLPTLATDTFWSAVLGPNFAAVATLPYPPAKVNDPRDPRAFLNGQILMMRRSAYQASGGFAAVRDEVLEDVALARRMKEVGLRPRLVEAQELAKTHMYTTLREHVDGWSKNIFDLVGRSHRRAVTLALFLLVMAWLPIVCVTGAILAGGSGEHLAALVALGGYALPTTVQIAIRARANAAPVFAPFAPIAASVVAATLVRAAFSSAPVRWKGRSYDRADRRQASRLSDRPHN